MTKETLEEHLEAHEDNTGEVMATLAHVENLWSEVDLIRAESEEAAKAAGQLFPQIILGHSGEALNLFTAEPSLRLHPLAVRLKDYFAGGREGTFSIWIPTTTAWGIAAQCVRSGEIMDADMLLRHLFEDVLPEAMLSRYGVTDLKIKVELAGKSLMTREGPIEVVIIRNSGA